MRVLLLAAAAVMTIFISVPVTFDTAEAVVAKRTTACGPRGCARKTTACGPRGCARRTGALRRY
jgi:hypothetical protein